MRGSALSWRGVKRIVLWGVRSVLWTRNVQVDDDRLLATAHDHRLHWLVFARVQLLMRDVGRNVDEISRTRFIDELQMISPAKARAAPHHVDHSFQFSMMMRTGLGIGVHHDGSRPELLRTDSGTRDGFGSSHAWRLGRVPI